ncbi:TonB-dependent receptor plug domain-containing protein [Aquabacterium sp.]|uniref:TonB-dependent receptor n=1 Tax=Aquabacterium sp. TaxID=1872578 RepID=UPI002486F585|nr:TonB-dependent receptor plug domain-containing protein [Aquabacterium sp.]MDI1258376.1 TonB-dependent receptor [Aquabacterium sp.]
MLFLNSVRLAPGVRSAVAVAVSWGWLPGAEVHAAEVSALPELQTVFVSASRMPQLLKSAPIGASVITSEQIARSGVSDANEAIRKLAGVSAKTDLSGGREYRLDLRGYGEVADQNMVVMVDGIRLSENELMPARLSAIPLDQIERIEIVRGGSSVLWGEGASAGVINVILKRGDQAISSGRVSAAFESFNGHDLQGSGTWGLGDVTLDAAVRSVRSDGYRDNAHYKQDSGSASIQWAHAGWRIKGRVQQENTDSGMPGTLSFAQFAANPRQANTPLDFAKTDETRSVINVEHKVGAWTSQIDVGTRERQSRSYYVGSSFASDSTSRNTQVSPRLAYADNWGAIDASGVVGVEAQDWSFVSGTEAGKQSSHAAFIHTNLAFPSRTRLAAGWRTEHVEKEGKSSAVIYDRKNHLNAAELALSQTVLTGLDVYGRWASSYRLPNVDENRYTPLQQALRPQENRDRELGLKWAKGASSATWRWFLQTTRDEIAYDPMAFANTNLDPTRRQGYELEGRWSPLPSWDWSATWQHVNATYRSGANAGLKQVLVAPESATLRTTYRFNERQLIDLGVQYLAAMRFNDDASNQCARKIPSSTTLDARYAWSDKTWTVAVSGANLTNQNSYNYAYSCATGALYPEPGRAFKLSLARQF